MWGPGDSEHKRDTDHPMELFPFYRGKTKAESKGPSPCASKLYYGASVNSRQLNPNPQINSGPTGNASFSSQAEGSSPCIRLKTLPLKTQLIMLTQSPALPEPSEGTRLESLRGKTGKERTDVPSDWKLKDPGLGLRSLHPHPSAAACFLSISYK